MDKNADLKKIIQEFSIAIPNIPYIPIFCLPYSNDERHEHRNWDKFIKLEKDVPHPVGIQNVHPERWFFCNGVVSDKSGWKLQADYISELFGKKVEALHNPTDTIVVDLIECMAGRVWNKAEAAAKKYVNILEPILRNGEEVHIIAYSQGGITLGNALKILHKKNVDTSKLSVYTFGSAHDFFDFDGKLYSEHFGNKNDYVARIGVLSYGAGQAKVYESDNYGHFLNAHYLSNFVKGDYCGGESKLYSYLKR